MDQKKKPFEVPTLTAYGTLNELTQAHHDKIKTTETETPGRGPLQGRRQLQG